MDRLILVYKSYGLYLIFTLICSFSAVSSLQPLYVITGENPQTVFINVVNNGKFINFLLAIIFITGSYFYLNRYKLLSRVVFDLLLLFLTAQVITIMYYFITLQIIKEDNITILVGAYFWLSAIALGLGYVFRYFYVGIERRNSEYVYTEKK